MRALARSVATYGCESWTLKASDKKRIAGFEMRAYRRMLRISWKDHRTNQSILEELDTNARLLNDIGLQRRKLWYFGHVVRADNLCASILHGHIEVQGNVEDHEDAGRTTSKTGPNYQWLSAWEQHRTEQHGVQRCRWLSPSTLRNEEEPVQSSPVILAIL